MVISKWGFPGCSNKQFEKLELKSLEQLNEVALKVNTLADFEKTLTDMPRKKQDEVAKHKNDQTENETLI